MSPDFRYYIDSFSTHVRPRRVSVHDVEGKELFEVGDRQGEAFEALDLPEWEFLTVEHDGREYPCMMLKPKNFDEHGKYPVIVYTYGGPGAQMVRKSWSRHTPWHALMTERGFVIFVLDNRGAPGYGKAWEDPLYRRFGNIELEDQVAGVEYLKTLPWVDADNVGIWGWSYGGYMTLMALFNRGDVFKAGASVAPVTDWRLYDSIYTERYLGLPSDNEDGYRESSPIHFVDDFDGHLLVMHGDADDNVHYQNTVRLVQKMIRAGKDFDLMVFPQKKHGISGTPERVFLYQRMTRFFQTALKGGSGGIGGGSAQP
jgi:dipeptidyl-peptidase-4